MTKYAIYLDVYREGRWTKDVFRKGFETIIEAAEAMQYLAHHDGDLGKKLSIREQSNH